MVFFALALAAYLLVAPSRRWLLLDPRPYAAAAVALLVLTPNILWNAGHHFVSYQHTADISQLDRGLFHPEAMLEFFLAQFAVFGPLTFAGLLVLAARPKSWFADDRLRFLAVFALVPLAAFLGLSLLSRAFANWAAFAYAAAAALVATVWLIEGKRGWLIAAIALHLAIAAGMYHLHDITDALGLQLTRKTDPYGRVTGYRALGQEVSRRLQAMPEAKLIGDDRKLFALMRYYARPYSDDARFLNPGGGIDNHYALTVDVRHAAQGTFLLVSPRDYGTRLSAWFEQVEPQPPIHLELYPDHAPVYRVWKLRNYRGP
jgi:hypothetical protein